MPIDHDPFPASLPLPDDPVKEGVGLRLCLVVGEMLTIPPHRDVHPRRVTGLAGADGQDVLQIDRRIEDAEYVWIFQNVIFISISSASWATLLVALSSEGMVGGVWDSTRFSLEDVKAGLKRVKA